MDVIEAGSLIPNGDFIASSSEVYSGQYQCALVGKYLQRVLSVFD